MKKVMLLLLMFLGITSYVQAQSSLYQQGYNLGVALATDCENQYQNQQIYNATSDSNQPAEYLNGLEDGWNLHINACDGDAIDDPGTTSGGSSWGIFIPGFGWFDFFGSSNP